MSTLMQVVEAIVLDVGRRWGEVAAPFQREDAAAILRDGPPWYHLLTRPRGASKTSDLALLCVVWLIAVAAPGARGYAVAADADQGALLVDAARRLLARNPTLRRSIKIEARRIVHTGKGATIEVVPADAASAYGLLPSFVVVDELSVWPGTRNARDVWTAIVSAVAKVDGCILVVLTSAGDPAHWSHKVLEHARKSKAWRVSEVPGPCPWISAAALAEQRGLLTESQFHRLHLNQWTAGEDRLVDAEALRDAVVLDGPQEPVRGRVYRIGVDLGLRRDRTAIAVAHAETVSDRDAPTRRVVLDRLLVFEGSKRQEVQLSQVEEAIFEASRTYFGAKVRLDPWQAVGLAQRLRRRGVHVEEFAFGSASVGRLAATLHLLLRDRLLALPDDEALLDELGAVRLRESSPGVVRMDHDSGRHDDMAISLALAATALIERPQGRTRTASASGRLQGGPVPAGPSVANRDGRLTARVLVPGRGFVERRLPSVAGRVKGAELEKRRQQALEQRRKESER